MKIETLKQLESLIKLCKKHGIEEIVVDGIQLKVDITHAADKKTARRLSTKDEDSEATYTDEDLINWSSMPIGQ